VRWQRGLCRRLENLLSLGIATVVVCSVYPSWRGPGIMGPFAGVEFVLCSREGGLRPPEQVEQFQWRCRNLPMLPQLGWSTN